MAQRRPDRVLGPQHDEFWAWCDRGELRLQRCEHCGRMAWPVVQACENCGKTRFDWERLSGLGRVVSWCSFEHDYYKGLFAIPHDTILVELEEGPLFVSTPDGFTAGEIVAGMRVTVSFLEAQDAAGPFRLPQFARA